MPYIGNSPGTGTRNRFIYTATASQTTFSGADDNGKTLRYSDGDYVDVYLNGICLVPVDDYAATSKTSIVLTVGAAVGDTLEVVAYDIATIADTVSKANGGTFNSTVTFEDGIVPTTGGTSNVSIGTNALDALDASSPGAYNVAIGTDALGSTTTANSNVAVGLNTLRANTTGQFNTSLGTQALQNSTTASYNVAVGSNSLFTNTTGHSNVSSGYYSLFSNTSGYYNTASGYYAGYSNSTGINNTFVGGHAGYSSSSANYNTMVGAFAGYSTIGAGNTFVGSLGSTGGAGCGYYVSTGNNNTIIGGYTGNQDGLDIRTQSNRIVLSDGLGNVSLWAFRDGSNSKVYIGNQNQGAVSGGYTGILTMRYAGGGTQYGIQFLPDADNAHGCSFFNAAGTPIGNITLGTSGTSYNTSSDYRLKEDVQPMTGASERVLALNPVNFAWKADGTRVDGFLAHEAQAVVPEAVSGEKDAMRDEEYEITPAVLDENGSVITEAVMGTRSVPDYQGIDQAKLVPLLTAALQEALTEITDLKARVAALEAN